ncbi:carbonyl reductase family member 4-like protein [Syncephalastrum racemosum]|uniref:Carbonyl reductase family member 4-like protein n=1 Tax=Syncephalastrum racemosum TaxID=13706 RepID=A0A1X2HPA5_SYNRA|nr:carbonyl reductase family member 4-like protein [Syncephalastrum racemosum]
MFAQKTAIVTGATRGIGKAIANVLAANGAQTILIGRDPQRVKDTEQLFQSTYGGGHHGVVLDITNKDDVAEAVKQFSKERSSLDFLVNSAGISRDGLLIQIKDQDVQESMETNLLGTMRMCQHVSKAMIRKKKGGCIINLSSVVGIHGNQGQSVYAASKAGVIGLTKSMAKELGPWKIRSNVIAPGYIETDMTADILKNKEQREAIISGIPLRRFGSVEDVAEAALFLARCQYMNGHVLQVDGGMFI